MFPSGHPATNEGLVYEESRWDGKTCLEYTPDGKMLDIREDKKKVGAFLNPYKYLRNLLEMPYVTVVLLLGVVSVLWSIRLGWRGSRRAVWFGGAGTVLTVLSLLLVAGWNGTAYYPSLTDMQSSLTISNSSSSLFTLKTMAWVSLFVPFVAAYIWYAWRAMNRRPITREEIRGDDHQY